MSLSIGGSDPAIVRALVRRTPSWSMRSGAEVRASDPSTCDVAVIRPGELGARLAQRDIVPVPDEIRNSAHGLQWSRCLSIWSDRLASWGGTPYAIPLAGESYVLVYNTRLFEAESRRAKRPVSPPTTWEEYADLAERFAVEGRTSLLPTTGNPELALREFQFVAACYDRPSLTNTEFNTLMQSAGSKESLTAAMLSFPHDIATGDPRVKLPAFVAAARWMARVARCRSRKPSASPDNPLAEIVNGSAVLAVVSLAELGRVPRQDGAAHRDVGIALLPGTRVWLDPTTGKPQPPGDKVKGVNFIPHFGDGGWIGVVHSNCKNPDAAFELLAELSGLDRSSELISDPTIGFGPFRVEHLDPARETIWQSYGFDSENSRNLVEAVRHHTGASLANPVVGLRGADRNALRALLAAAIAKIEAGTLSAEAAMEEADAGWRKLDASRVREDLFVERRQAAGLR